MYKHQRHVLTMLVVIMLSACDSLDKPTSLFDQYSKRLARVLEYSEINNELAPLVRLPRPRERRYEIPSL
jgi:uncharacterized lipoprotein